MTHKKRGGAMGQTRRPLLSVVISLCKHMFSFVWPEMQDIFSVPLWRNLSSQELITWMNPIYL